jgi:hypothetical protein
MKRQRKEKGFFLILLFLDEKKQKSHTKCVFRKDSTELAKNLMYSLNLPIPPHMVM